MSLHHVSKFPAVVKHKEQGFAGGFQMGVSFEVERSHEDCAAIVSVNLPRLDAPQSVDVIQAAIVANSLNVSWNRQVFVVRANNRAVLPVPWRYLKVGRAAGAAGAYPKCKYPSKAVDRCGGASADRKHGTSTQPVGVAIPSPGAVPAGLRWPDRERHDMFVDR